MKNTCFLDNNFRREAPVMVFDGHPVEASNNYGTQDDDVACQFLIEFPNDAALEALQNYTCIEYDADSCQATEPVPSPTAPGPTGGSPAEQPTPQANSAVANAVSILWLSAVSLVIGASMI